MKLPLILLVLIGMLGLTANVRAEGASIQQLTAEEVELIVTQAVAKAIRINPKAIIAVTDREGFVLALWDVSGKVPVNLPVVNLLSKPNLRLYSLVAAAVTRASSAAFLSSDQNAFTSRTAGFIIQQHFPPGIRNTGNGPLVGVGLSSLFYSDVNRVKLFDNDFNGAQTTFFPAGRPPISVDPNLGTISPGVRADLFPLTSLNDSPGGVPLYKGGHLVGGIGVTGDGSPSNLTPAGAFFFGQVNRDSTFTFKTGEDSDEEVALAGQTNFRPSKEIHASNVLINGIRIPYVYRRAEQIEDVGDVEPLGTHGHPINVPVLVGTLGNGGFASGNPRSSPAQYPYPVAVIGGVEGEIRFPFRDDPLRDSPILARRTVGKRGYRLTKEDVKDIITKAAERANRTRAGIRLPIGTTMKVFISVVANPDRPGDLPQILGVFRTGEATIFSWDVAVQKARTAIFFSNNQLAMTSRSVGFLAQRFYPPGLDGREPGPLFGFQEAVSLRTNPRPPAGPFFKNNPFLPTVLVAPPNGPLGFPGNTNVPNGITIFPGGAPLYRNGELVGAIGISGDGVDQDDIVAASGCEDFLPNPRIRADHFSYRGARLPYVKYPRDPEQ